MTSGTERIPRVFHRIWFGGDMPAEYQEYGETFRRHHPDWLIMLWDERNLPRLRNQREFDRASSYAQMADIARYEIVHAHGGVYIDTDFECLKRIDPLLEGVGCFSAAEAENYFAIGIFGARPGHEFLNDVIEAIPASMHEPGGPVHQTGPVMFTRLLLDRRRRGVDDVVTFPSKLFYPYHFTQPHLKSASFPEAYAVHHWAGSWHRGRPRHVPSPPSPAGAAPSGARRGLQIRMTTGADGGAFVTLTPRKGPAGSG